MEKVKTQEPHKPQGNLTQSNKNFVDHHSIKHQKNQHEYFSQRMRVLSNGPHDDQKSNKRLLAELYFQNW